MMKTEYKYYMYYLKSNRILYAYTDEPKIAKKFEEDRDISNMFYKKKVWLAYDDIVHLTDSISSGGLENNIGKRLSLKELATYNHKQEHKDSVKIAMTETEFTSVINYGMQLAENTLFVDAWLPSEYMVTDLRKALQVFDYDLYNAFVTGTKSKNTPPILVNALNQRIDIDYFSVFLHQYGFTMQLEREDD